VLIGVLRGVHLGVWEMRGNETADVLVALLSDKDSVLSLFMLAAILPILSKMSKCMQKSENIFSDVLPLREHYCGQLNNVATSLRGCVQFDMSWTTINAAAVGLVKPEGDWLKHDDVVEFHARVCVPFVNALITQLRSGIGMTPLLQAFGVFDPRGDVIKELPNPLPGAAADVDLSAAKSALKTVTDYYSSCPRGAPAFLTPERCAALEAELYPALKLIKETECTTYQDVMRLFLGCVNTRSMFPETAHFLSIVSVLPIGTATVERLFSLMKLIKTRFRKNLHDATLSDTIMLAMNGRYSVERGIPLDALAQYVNDWNAVDHNLYFADITVYLEARGAVLSMREYSHRNRSVMTGIMKSANAGLFQPR